MGAAFADDAATNPNLAVTSKRWGPDHPHEFAKGCDDNVLPSSAEGTDGGGREGEAGQTAQADVANKVPPEDYEEASEFGGKKDGWCFKLGSRGLGYYRDTR